ncbi:MAG: glycosyltransferase [Chitinophagaceae bacterium]|nr:glycosyltransferase [Chitinophagaceae bacterium]
MRIEQKIKLLIIIPTLECGGSERYVSLLCSHIDVEQFELTLVVLDNSHPFFEVDARRVELVELGIKRVRNALFAIKRVISQKNPDIVYTAANHLNVLLATFRWMFPKKMLFIARESSIVSLNSKRANYPELYVSLIRNFYNRFDLIICQSAYMQMDLVKHFHIPANKTRHLANPVAVPETLLPVAGSKQDQPIPHFISVARLSEEKGIDRLIRSVSLLGIAFHYHIIGEGKERETLQQLIDQLQLGDRVFLEGEKLNPWLHASDMDLFLMGSHYEGFPNALCEAGMLGIPAVAFDAPGGIGEIIVEGENGLLVRDHDEPLFAASINKALKHSFDREKIIALTKKRYAVDVIMEETEKLFRSVL